MRNHAKISQVAHYLPKKIVTNDDLAQRMETSDEWIRSRTGIGQRHIVTGETTSDLASQVARKLLEKSQLDASEIDFIIVATITPDASMPSTAAMVQAAIGEKAFAYDLVAACSGFVLRYQQRKNYLLQESIREDLSLVQRPYLGLSTGRIDQRLFYLEMVLEEFCWKRANNQPFSRNLANGWRSRC